MKRQNRHTTQRTQASQSESQGSVWTSFSDLFTSVAIIFLVMFVVAMIRLSLSSFESKQAKQDHQDFLEGNVPAQARTKAEQRKQELKDYVAKIESYKKQLMQRTSEIEQFANGLSQHESVIDGLLVDQQEKSAAMENLSKNIESKAKELKERDARIAKLVEELKQQKLISAKAIERAQVDITRIKQESDAKIQQMKLSSTQEIEQARAQHEALRKKSDSSKRFLEESNERLLAELGKRQQALRDLDAKLASSKANIAALSTRTTLRQQIATRLSDRFEANGIVVNTNPISGNVTLLMDEAFLFVNDSFIISDPTKDQLRNIVPIYAEELLGDPLMRKVVSAINIVGHASPRYKKAFVDVRTSDPESFDHNLRLSLNRAQEISNFIFGDEMESFAHRDLMRAKIHVVGRSFAEPVALTEDDRADPDREFGRCGDFNCKRSRRVEISFSLAEGLDRDQLPLVDAVEDASTESLAH